MTTTRSNDRLGRLAEHRARWLDQMLPSWRVDDRSIEYEARWREKLVELLVFIDVHGRRPKDRQLSSGLTSGIAAFSDIPKTH